jgi:hypothetical protein
MKKNLFIAAIAAVATLASCGTEKPVVGLDAGPAQLTIKLQGPSTRAIDDSEDGIDADNVINDLIAFITRADGTFDVKPYYTDADAIKNGGELKVPATTEAKNVYIVTNTGPLTSGPFAAVSNMTELRAVSAKIDGTNVNKVKPGNVWMSGQSGEIEEKIIEGKAVVTDKGVPVLTAEVQLWYIPAKVFVITVNDMSNYSASSKVQLKGVTITNAGAWTGFIMTNPEYEANFFKNEVNPDFRNAAAIAQIPFYYNGVDIASFNADWSYEYYDEPMEDAANNYVQKDDYYSDKNFDKIQVARGASTNDAKVVEGDANSPYDLDDEDAFYIFPTLGAGDKVWASVHGVFNDASQSIANQDRFWNAAFGGADQAETGMVELKSGNKYIVTLEMRGEANNVTDPGELDPTIETLNAELVITVKQAKWNVITGVGKTFE